MNKDEVLSGNMNSVVRRGDHVHRPVGLWTPAVHSLLRHLESKQLEGIPRVVGFDEVGREVLTFIEGESGADLSSWVWDTDTLKQVGEWLRDYHRSVADFQEPRGSTWRMCWAPQAPGEIICHFDVAPRNLILRPNGRIAIIDFEVAAPGDARLELGKVCNNFLAFSETDAQIDLSESAQRLHTILKGYGWREPTQIVSWMIEATTHSYKRIERAAEEGDAALRALLDSGKIDHLLTIHSWLLDHQWEFEHALSLEARSNQSGTTQSGA